MSAKVFDMEKIRQADALVAEALADNPHALDRLTSADIARILRGHKMTTINLRIPVDLLDALDEHVREEAFKEGRRLTRSSKLIELIRNAIELKTTA